LADAAPVLNAPPDGCICDPAIDALCKPGGVGAGAGLSSGGLEEAACVTVGVSERDGGRGVEPCVECTWFSSSARGARVFRLAASERREPGCPFLRPGEDSVAETEPTSARWEMFDQWEKGGENGRGSGGVSVVASCVEDLFE